MIEYDLTMKRLDFKIKLRMLQFMFIKGNKMYMLQFTVASEKTDTDLNIEMKKYLPFYRLVANAIINDQ